MRARAFRWPYRQACGRRHAGSVPAPGRLHEAAGAGGAAGGERAGGGRSLRTGHPRGSARAEGHAVLRSADGPHLRPGDPGAWVHGRRRHAGLHGPDTAPARLPHLPLAHPRQCRLHPQRRGPARVAPRVDRAATRYPGADRRPQPRRDAGPRPRRTPTGPGVGHRHDGQPDAGARGTPRGAVVRRRRAGAAQPRRRTRSDVGGVRGRHLCPAGLGREPGAGARRRRLHRDLQQARRHLRLAGVHRPRGDRGRGHRVTRRHGRGPAGDRPGHRGAAADRVEPLRR